MRIAHHVAVRVLLASLSLSGCAFDSRVSSTKKVRCGPNGECPRPLVCVPDIGLCRTPGDNVPPVIAATTNKSAYKLGDTVRLEAASSEVLREVPRLYALVEGTERSFEFDGPGDTDVTYRFVSQVTSKDAEGSYLVFADAEDLSTNPAIAARTGASFVVDNTPPTIDVTRSAITPRIQRDGLTVAVTLVPSEPVDLGARLIAKLNGTSTVVADTAQLGTNNTRLEFALFIPSGTPNSEWSLSVSGLIDLAGNVASDAGASAGRVTVDSTAPVISPLGISGLVRSARPGFNTVQIPLQVNDPDARVTLCLSWSGCTVHDAGTIVTYVVKDTDPEGSQAVTVQAEDRVGNRAVPLSETLVFDFTPPSIQGTPRIELTPPPGCPFSDVTTLAAGATATAFFTVNEEMALLPPVGSGDAGWSGVATAAREYRYQLLVDGGLPDGLFTVTALFRDAVGNEGARTLGTINVDRTPPPPLAPALPGRASLARFPWGSTEVGSQPQVRFAADAGTFEPNARVVLWDDSNLATASQIAVFKADPNGRLVSSLVSQFDRLNVFASQYDTACNRDSATATLVRQQEWIASLGGKVPGSTAKNPHSFLSGAQEFPRRVTPAFAREVAGPILAAQDGITQSQTVSEPAVTGVDLGPPSAGEVVWDSHAQKTFLHLGYLSWYGIASYWDGSRRTTQSGAFGPAITLPGSLFFDETMAREIMLGLSYGTTSGETWTYDGRAFDRIATQKTPPLRASTASAYDPVRKRGVLFGGYSIANTPIGDTWEWTGEDWVEATPTSGPSPSPRALHHMAWDPIRKEILLFGGLSTSTGQLDDLWGWNGSRWALVPTSGSRPSARDAAAIAFDTARSALIVFGGRGPPSDGGSAVEWLADTWELTGSTWTRRAAFTPFLAEGCQTDPTSKDTGLTAAYDSARQVTVAFCPKQRSVFEWNGTAWAKTPVSFGQEPQGADESFAYPMPSRGGYVGASRRGWVWTLTDAGVGVTESAKWVTEPTGQLWPICHTWDDARGVMVLIRTDGPPSGLTSTGGRWAAMTNEPPSAALAGCQMAYDPVRQKTVLFAVGDGSTWEWAGGAWTNKTPGSPSPAARNGAALYFDSDRARVVLAGGVEALTGISPSNVWEWDGTSWAERTVAGSVSFSGYQAIGAAYDPLRKRTVLASPGPGNSARVLELYDGGWTPPQVVDIGLSSIWYGSIFWDPTLQSVVFAGTSQRQVSSGSWQAPTRLELWRWTGTGRGGFIAPLAAGPTAYEGLAFDPVQNAVVVFDGSSTWAWNPSSGVWSRIASWSSPGPGPRVGSSLAYDPLRQKVLLYGGYAERAIATPLVVGDFFTDTWEWNGTAWTRVIASGSGPGARRNAALDFNTVKGRVVILGGAVFGGGAVWEWTGSTWVSTGSVGGGVDEVADFGHAFDSTRGVLVASGGTRWSPYAGWTSVRANVFGEWGTSWQPQAVPPWAYSTQNTSLGLAYDPVRQATWALKMFGSPDPFHPSVLLYKSPTSISEVPLLGVTSQIGNFGAPQPSDLVYDSNGGRVIAMRPFIMVAGTDPDVVPIQVMNVQTGYAALPTGSVVTALEARFVSGASGVGTTGTRLQRHNGIDWVSRATNSAAVSAPAALVDVETNSTAIAALMKSQVLSFGVVPISKNSTSVPATLATDYSEIRLRYTLP